MVIASSNRSGENGKPDIGRARPASRGGNASLDVISSLSPHSAGAIVWARSTLSCEGEMGANPYFYFTRYQENLQRALDLLREQEFKAGRYDPAMQMADPPRYMFQMTFPPDASWPSPGARHGSITQAIDAAMESGTGSILDLFRIASAPDYGCACPLPDDNLLELFGTTQPTRELVQSILFPKRREDYRIASSELLWDRIKRGQGRYIIVYADGEPCEIFFAGYSYD
jgi:hypothetical protein